MQAMNAAKAMHSKAARKNSPKASPSPKYSHVYDNPLLDPRSFGNALHATRVMEPLYQRAYQKPMRHPPNVDGLNKAQALQDMRKAYRMFLRHSQRALEMFERYQDRPGASKVHDLPTIAVKLANLADNIKTDLDSFERTGKLVGSAFVVRLGKLVTRAKVWKEWNALGKQMHQVALGILRDTGRLNRYNVGAIVAVLNSNLPNHKNIKNFVRGELTPKQQSALRNYLKKTPPSHKSLRAELETCQKERAELEERLSDVAFVYPNEPQFKKSIGRTVRKAASRRYGPIRNINNFVAKNQTNSSVGDMQTTEAAGRTIRKAASRRSGRYANIDNFMARMNDEWAKQTNASLAMAKNQAALARSLSRAY
jgi:hypothetical protein